MRVTFRGLRLDVPHENIGGVYSILIQGLYEPVLRTLSREDIVIDGGANIGVFSLLAAAKCYAVYAVEPNRANLSALSGNIARNRVHNVQVVPGVLSDSTGTRIFDGQGEAGHLSLSGIETESHTISSIARGRATVIKLDIEGAEPAALTRVSECPFLRAIVYEKDVNAWRRLRDWKLAESRQSYSELETRLRGEGFDLTDMSSIGPLTLRNLVNWDVARLELATGFYGTRFLVGESIRGGPNAIKRVPTEEMNIIYATRIRSRGGIN